MVDLNLYKCRTRKRIHIRSLIQPISTELHPPCKNVCFSFPVVCGKLKVYIPSIWCLTCNVLLHRKIFLMNAWNTQCCSKLLDWIAPITRDCISAVEKLFAGVRPPEQPGQLPQLQHYPGARDAGHAAQSSVHTNIQQGVSPHGALQVLLQCHDILTLRQ